ncbi:ribosomal protein S18-alanine N-acetyltransferase [Candidatus Methylopumilus turicensis]|uniref:[Ribosomal protein bS18]-alanine N-acetyltransferase n=1 Tax=Candidatus Methylopumilus turicensis TaxID=1581680 RepID=A0A0B7IWA4_9PROT|nr:ribosomal protein S18-alanine N-acetyltransferase [Candidatus Methylopumilus turicensis]CEN55377.1 Ribosomal-protein-alanine acetyltransferase [Candidatus Methylopumilus turicensis]
MNAPLNQPNVSFREMQIDDLDAVIQIETVNFPFPWTAGNFKDSINSGHICLVLEIDELMIGYAILMMVLDEAHLLNISISADWKGKGWGRHLLNHMMQISREQGGLNMFLEVRPSNVSAITLYESIGFNEMGVRPGYYPAHNGRENAVLMGVAL